MASTSRRWRSSSSPSPECYRRQLNPAAQGGHSARGGRRRGGRAASTAGLAVPRGEEGRGEHQLGDVTAVVHPLRRDLDLSCRVSCVGRQLAGTGVQQLPQVAVRRPREHQHHQPGTHPGASRRRVGSRDRPGEQVARCEEVRVQQVVHGFVLHRRGVQRCQVQRVHAAHGQDRSADRMRHDVQTPQHGRDRSADSRRRRAQQEPDRRAHHQAQRSKHAEQDVLDHVSARLVRDTAHHRGERERDEHHTTQPAGGPPGAPTTSAAGAVGADTREIGRAGDRQDEEREQPTHRVDRRTLAAVRERVDGSDRGRSHCHRGLGGVGSPSPRLRSASTAPAASRRRPPAFHARS